MRQARTRPDSYRAVDRLRIREDHDGWRDMLVSRNLTSHTYDEETADEITGKIIDVYFPLMDKLYENLRKKYQD